MLMHCRVKNKEETRQESGFDFEPYKLQKKCPFYSE